MKIFENIDSLVGNTPLLRASGIKTLHSFSGELLAKLECFNPTGSAKDRAALGMVLDAEKKGLLKNGSTLIEPTSGNTGISLAAIGAARGYKVIIVMPDSMSRERIMLMKAYGAEVVLTAGAKGMGGCIEKAEELKALYENAIIPSQFDNPANPHAHYLTTGPEIWDATEGKIDFFVAGIGTGGTLSGAGKYLKEKNPEIKIIGVEPLSSPLLTEGRAGTHGIQGIGANFVPENLDRGVYDGIITVSNEDAFGFSREFARNEGIAVGISSGAALSAAVTILKMPENQGKTAVALLTDTGERYLSTALYD